MHPKLITPQMQRRLQIIQHLANGDTLQSASEKVKLSHRTAEAYVGRMRELFEAKNTAHLIAILLREKLIE